MRKREREKRERERERKRKREREGGEGIYIIKSPSGTYMTVSSPRRKHVRDC